MRAAGSVIWQERQLSEQRSGGGAGVGGLLLRKRFLRSSYQLTAWSPSASIPPTTSNKTAMSQSHRPSFSSQLYHQLALLNDRICWAFCWVFLNCLRISEGFRERAAGGGSGVGAAGMRMTVGPAIPCCKPGAQHSATPQRTSRRHAWLQRESVPHGAQAGRQQPAAGSEGQGGRADTGRGGGCWQVPSAGTRRIWSSSCIFLQGCCVTREPLTSTPLTHPQMASRSRAAAAPLAMPVVILPLAEKLLAGQTRCAQVWATPQLDAKMSDACGPTDVYHRSTGLFRPRMIKH